MQNVDYEKIFLEICNKRSVIKEEAYYFYLSIASFIEHEEWLKIANHPYMNTTKGIYGIKLAIQAYMGSREGLYFYDRDTAAKGAILHNFYPYNRQDPNFDKTKIKLPNNNILFINYPFFADAHSALNHAKKHFPELFQSKVTGNKIPNIILSSAWPLSFNKPKYREAEYVNINHRQNLISNCKNPKNLGNQKVKIFNNQK